MPVEEAAERAARFDRAPLAVLTQQDDLGAGHLSGDR